MILFCHDNICFLKIKSISYIILATTTTTTTQPTTTVLSKYECISINNYKLFNNIVMFQRQTTKLNFKRISNASAQLDGSD